MLILACPSGSQILASASRSTPFCASERLYVRDLPDVTTPVRYGQLDLPERLARAPALVLCGGRAQYLASAIHATKAKAPAVVFGGTGFIGRHLAHALVPGHDRVVLCDVAKPAWALSAGMEFRQCDVRDPIELERIGPTAPLVFNLAAVHRTPGHADREYHETNEGGAEHVTAFCDRHDVTDLWFTSSIAVYGPSEAPVTEQTPLGPESAYGRSKAAAEAMHAAWAGARDGRRLVTVRPGTVFGPGEGGNFTRLRGPSSGGAFSMRAGATP